MSRFEFLTQVIQGQYGYSFYYDHSSDQDEKWVFFRPELKPENPLVLDSLHLLSTSFSFSAGLNSGSRQVKVLGHSGPGEVSASQVEGGFSESGKAIQKLRLHNKTASQAQFYFPNQNSTFCKDYAHSKLVHDIMDSQVMRCTLPGVFNVGQYLKFTSSIEGSPKLFEGTYLVTEATHTQTKNSWSHSYALKKG
jgi:hypothetical protein